MALSARPQPEGAKAAFEEVPFGHWKTQTFIAGLRCDALTAPLRHLTRRWTGAFLNRLTSRLNWLRFSSRATS